MGAVIYGVGATAALVKGYGLRPMQGCELVRIALRSHHASVSRIVAVSLRMVKRAFPGLRLVVSFADPDYGHHGGIYQAGNWIYTGLSNSAREYVIGGKRLHGRVVHLRYGSKIPFRRCAVPGSRKHRYLMPLDAEMRAKLLPRSKPYPKRERSAAGGAAGVQPAGGGSTPTRSLLSVGD